MLATAFLRAFWFLEKNNVILSDEEILAHFYESEEVLGFEEGNAWVKLHPEAHLGARVAEDVKPARHREPVVAAGKTLNAKLIEKLVEANVEKIPVRAESLVGRRTATRIVDTESGEVLVQTNTEINAQILSQIMGRRVAPFNLLVPVLPGMPTVKPTDKKVDQSMYETLARDHVKNPDEALVEIYRKLRPGDPPTVESARALFRGMFMDPRRYDLARVGRFMINKKLQIEAPLSVKTLRSEDIVAVIRHLLMVKLGSKSTDDIDHLGNRRVRSVGELLENQFRVGLTRMERAVKERMSISDITNLMPHDLINAKPVSAVVKEFFGSSQLSQFMDQTNPLAELTHKRRLSALGPGGLSRERAGFDVRDVHHSHYGRICPIDTPEGPNIGLIGSHATYARVHGCGVLETTFRQHDDANGARMGSNMQRQAVPLLVTAAPIVGTGMEVHAARNSGELVINRLPGTVAAVAYPEPPADDRTTIRVRSGQDSPYGILVRPDDGSPDIWYGIHKFVRSNQGTCLSQRTIVTPGQRVEAGDVLADGPSTDDGELALGRNVLVAFMPWEGYNFEDAILISESVVREDKYTSIHIEEYEIEARDTKLGPEEITRDIPNVSDETLKNLDERGIVYIGAEVHPGDILVGK